MMNEVFLQETHGHRVESVTPQLSADIGYVVQLLNS